LEQALLFEKILFCPAWASFACFQSLACQSFFLPLHGRFFFLFFPSVPEQTPNSFYSFTKGDAFPTLMPLPIFKPSAKLLIFPLLYFAFLTPSFVLLSFRFTLMV